VAFLTCNLGHIDSHLFSFLILNTYVFFTWCVFLCNVFLILCVADPNIACGPRGDNRVSSLLS
jgi:hypothetical protein